MKTNKAHNSSKTMEKILILQVMAPTSDGEIFARPVSWEEAGDEPIVYIEHDKFTGLLSYGDRIRLGLNPSILTISTMLERL